jgi:CheY-like chemotaxis protein
LVRRGYSAGADFHPYVCQDATFLADGRSDSYGNRKIGKRAMKKKILLVEDNPTAAVMMQIQIEFLGYEVEVAKDGLQAIKMASLVRPDLVVLDIRMPELDGYDTAKRLRATPGLMDVPILAATAYAQPGAREKCLASGCDDYISKPFNHSQLAHAIRKLLSRASERTEDK